MDKKKVYITRDEGSDFIFVWRKPTKGSWSPTKKVDCEMIIWLREDIDHMDYYHKSDFKKKFNITIPKKKRQCVHIPYNLLNNEDYKLISDNPDRKR